VVRSGSRSRPAWRQHQGDGGGGDLAGSAQSVHTGARGFGEKQAGRERRVVAIERGERRRSISIPAQAGEGDLEQAGLLGQRVGRYARRRRGSSSPAADPARKMFRRD
jgi:hypothetical protein